MHQIELHDIYSYLLYRNQSGPIRNRGEITNNTAEVQAAVRAIRIAARHNIKKLLILTDSKLVVELSQYFVNSQFSIVHEYYRTSIVYLFST